MRATEELVKEHEGIKVMLNILTAVAKKIKSGGAVPQKDLEDIAEFLSIFADKCHHGKEEVFLFPALEQTGVPRENGPIGVMLAEHIEARKIISQLKNAFAEHGSGMESAADKISESANEYVNLISQHIEKENGVLFPMADQRLNEADDDRLVESFEDLERERIGPGKHEEFHAMLERFKKEYLL